MTTKRQCSARTMDTILLIICLLCLPSTVHSQSPTTECPDGTYGPPTCGSCSPNCADTCDKTTGHCTCKPGFKTSLCNQPCGPKQYGQGCASTCGHCVGGAECDKETGHCSSCEAGYTGDKCNANCPAKTFGAGCSDTCGECEEATCNHVTGQCQHCKPGFQLPQCTQECTPGVWGTDCMTLCSENCQNSSACDKVTGHCVCKPGFAPPLCRQPCAPGKFGQDCTGQCGNCQGGRTGCDRVTGRCSRCVDNFELPLCKGCVAGHYGPKCGERCGQCGGEGRCDKATGVCLSGDCLPGWTSPSCRQKCPEGTYGLNCSKICGNCKDNTVCRHDNGICEQECRDGYEGVLCLSEKAKVVEAVVGSVLGAAVLIVIAIVLTGYFLQRRSKEMVLPKADGYTTFAEFANNVNDTNATNDQNATGDNPDDTVRLNPPTNYDRVDMTVRNEHLYDVQTAAAAAADADADGQQDPVYMNTEFKPQEEEPEAFYGNL